MPYRHAKSTDTPLVEHADHIWEGWTAYLSDTSDAPEYVNGDSSGICCHSCKLIIVEIPA